MADEDVNVCCGYLGIIDCADTEEHSHIVCSPKEGLDDNPVIDNEHAKAHRLSEQFKECPYYPKRG